MGRDFWEIITDKESGLDNKDRLDILWSYSEMEKLIDYKWKPSTKLEIKISKMNYLLMTLSYAKVPLTRKEIAEICRFTEKEMESMDIRLRAEGKFLKREPRKKARKVGRPTKLKELGRPPDELIFNEELIDQEFEKPFLKTLLALHETEDSKEYFQALGKCIDLNEYLKMINEGIEKVLIPLRTTLEDKSKRDPKYQKISDVFIKHFCPDSTRILTLSDLMKGKA